MDDNGLRKQGLDEPPRLEQGRGIPGVEGIQHHEERGVVEDGAERPHAQDELLDALDAPTLGLGHELLVHVVRGDRRLREVVQ